MSKEIERKSSAIDLDSKTVHSEMQKAEKEHSLFTNKLEQQKKEILSLLEKMRTLSNSINEVENFCDTNQEMEEKRKRLLENLNNE